MGNERDNKRSKKASSSTDSSLEEAQQTDTETVVAFRLHTNPTSDKKRGRARRGSDISNDNNTQGPANQNGYMSDDNTKHLMNLFLRHSIVTLMTSPLPDLNGESASSRKVHPAKQRHLPLLEGDI